MNDNEVLDAVRSSFPVIEMDRPVEAILARGHTRQVRRRSALVAAGVALSATAIVTVTSIAGSGGSGTSTHPGAKQVQLAAFTVVKNPNGTATVTFPVVQANALINPTALRQALANAGVPAIVTIGRTCSNRAGAAADPRAVVQVQSPSSPSSSSGQTISVVITPSALPAGTELSIGIYPQQRSWQLANANAPLTCTSTPSSGQ